MTLPRTRQGAVPRFQCRGYAVAGGDTSERIPGELWVAVHPTGPGYSDALVIFVPDAGPVVTVPVKGRTDHWEIRDESDIVIYRSKPIAMEPGMTFTIRSDLDELA